MIPRRRADVTIRDVAGEMLILDRRHEQVHQLNSTASYIWQRCDGNMTVADIVVSMVHDFGVKPENVEKDVIETIAQLRLLRLFESALPAEK